MKRLSLKDNYFVSGLLYLVPYSYFRDFFPFDRRTKLLFPFSYGVKNV